MGFSSGSSGMQTKQFEGLFGSQKNTQTGRLTSPSASQIGQRALNIINSPSQIPLQAGIFSNPIFDEQARSINFSNVPFGPTTSSEQALLKAIKEQVQGETAVRGLGTATEAGLAQKIAPALIGLRQQKIQNQLAQRGQTLQTLLAEREQNINTQRQVASLLLTLAEMAMPQIVGGQVGRTIRVGL